jgi:pseudouridine-5'-phosphate glycosidase
MSSFLAGLPFSAMDISSDLTELIHTRTAIVCAGAKSILDIGLTLEYLETLGVTVTTFGNTTDFPAFYARKSGYKAPFNVRTASEAAHLLCESPRYTLRSFPSRPVPST